MLEDIRLIQGYTCCNLGGNRILYRTEKYGLICEFDSDTGIVRILNKEMLKNTPSYITFHDNVIYAVDSNGKWIAESKNDEYGFKYYDLDVETGVKFEGYYSICSIKGKIYLFCKRNNTVLVFDTISKQIDRYFMDTGKRLDGICVDTSSVYNGLLYLFSSKSRMVLVYSIQEKRIISQNTYEHVPKIVSIMAGNDKIYILSNNTVYEYSNDFNSIFTIDETKELQKIGVVKNDIWILPGLGEDIYVYSMDSGIQRKLEEYPGDFEYCIDKGRTKYIGRCVTENYLCWLLRAGNYFLRIDKETGKYDWVKPKILGVDNAIRQFTEQKWCISEEYISLNNYLSALKDLHMKGEN